MLTDFCVSRLSNYNVYEDCRTEKSFRGSNLEKKLPKICLIDTFLPQKQYKSNR